SAAISASLKPLAIWCITVAGFVPSLNCTIDCAISSRGFPAREATGEPATVRPPVPWHGAQLAAIERTPLSVRFGAAHAGAGAAGACCCGRGAEAMAVNAAASAIELRRFMSTLPLRLATIRQEG